MPVYDVVITETRQKCITITAANQAAAEQAAQKNYGAGLPDYELSTDDISSFDITVTKKTDKYTYLLYMIIDKWAVIESKSYQTSTISDIFVMKSDKAYTQKELDETTCKLMTKLKPFSITTSPDKFTELQYSDLAAFMNQIANEMDVSIIRYTPGCVSDITATYVIKQGAK